jgi:Tat protein translocase TatC
MREVRMTFGEHLEELRWRVIMALLFLAVGVTFAFIWGEDLMEVALQPHQRAFQGAQRTRMVQKMEVLLKDLEPLWSPDPYEAKVGRESFRGSEIRWEALFVGDVARTRLVRELTPPFLNFVSDLPMLVPSLDSAERAALGRAIERLGEDFSSRLVQQFASGLEVGEDLNLPRRFERILQKSRDLEGTESLPELKRLVGWGKDVGGVVERLKVFLRFLDQRRTEAEASKVELEELRVLVRKSRFVDMLAEAAHQLEEALRGIAEAKSPRILVIDYLESFASYLKVALIFGLLFSIPFILYEAWKFVGAGLHLHEQRYVVTFLPFSLALFACGAFFGFKVLVPVGLEFLAGWGSEEVELSFTLGNYIGLFFTLTFLLGLVFQTPLVMVFLAKLDIVGVDAYRRHRRIAIFAGVCLAVLLTPPDPFSWSLMALPMVLLYELGIGVCRLLGRTPRERSA